MKLPILLIGAIVLIDVVSATAQRPDSMSALIVYYEDAMSPRESIAQCGEWVFFHKFPSDFESFMKIYNLTDADNLYDYGEDHILRLLGHPRFIDKEFQIRKLVYLGVGGSWSPDAAGYLQHVIRENIAENMEIAYSIFKSMEESHFRSFMRFYLDGRFALNSIPDELNWIKLHDAELYSVIEQVFSASMNGVEK